MRSFVTSIVISTLIAFVLLFVFARPAQAQTYQVIYNFSGGLSGAYPDAGLTIDQAGNLYGITTAGYGTVFKLKRSGSGWILTPLYRFGGGTDGANPKARVIIGPNGTLYGTTSEGGEGGACQSGGYTGCGTVFNLRPPEHACTRALCGWNETILYRFTGGSDGAYPAYGDLVFDQVGNIYGTTWAGGGTGCGGYGGGSGCGTVFELTPSNGGWRESVLYSFTGGNDGGNPLAGVIFDKVGNLFGPGNNWGAYGCGTVYELTSSGSGWTENTIYDFNPGIGDGCTSVGGLIFDEAGNLYGTTSSDGSQDGGTVYELTPHQDGSWTETVVYAFSYNSYPVAALAIDAAGNLYGTTVHGGIYGYGSVFKLAPSGDGWLYSSLHDFTGGSDGAGLVGGVIFDAKGNLYGTTGGGGAHGYGVVWEITP